MILGQFRWDFAKKNFFLKKDLEKFHNFFFHHYKKKISKFLGHFPKKKFMSRNDFGTIPTGFRKSLKTYICTRCTMYQKKIPNYQMLPICICHFYVTDLFHLSKSFYN